MLVTLFPENNKADLFERAGRISIRTNETQPEDPTADLISNECVTIFEHAAGYKDEEFNDEDVDGGI